MAPVERAERVTGYVAGGMSPLGQRRPLPTYLDDSAKHLDTLFVSAGRRGLEIELAPDDLHLANTRHSPKASPRRRRSSPALIRQVGGLRHRGSTGSRRASRTMRSRQHHRPDDFVRGQALVLVAALRTVPPGRKHKRRARRLRLHLAPLVPRGHQCPTHGGVSLFVSWVRFRRLAGRVRPSGDGLGAVSAVRTLSSSRPSADRTREPRRVVLPDSRCDRSHGFIVANSRRFVGFGARMRL